MPKIYINYMNKLIKHTLFFTLLGLIFNLFFEPQVFARRDSQGLGQDQKNIISHLLKSTPHCDLSEVEKDNFFWTIRFVGYEDHGFGFCLMWLYSKWLKVNHAEKVASSNYDWFKNTIADIVGIGCDAKDIDNCRMHDCNNIEKFATLTAIFQRAWFKIGIEQNPNLLLELDGNKAQVEYSIASLFTQEQLKQLFKENIIHDHKLVFIMSHNRVSALFKDGSNYYYYDPDDHTGEIAVQTTTEVAELIFAVHHFVPTNPSPLLFVMLSLDKTDVSVSYPCQKEILDHINPTLYGVSDYAKGYSGLHLATIWGCLESIEYFVTRGGDLNIVNDNHSSALMLAVLAGRKKVVELLLKKGAAINQTCYDGDTALKMAVSSQQYEIANLLLAYGADPNIADRYDETPLMVAARKGYLPLVYSLIEKGADIDAKDYRASSAIIYADSKGHTDIVKVLKEKGAKDSDLVMIMNAVRTGQPDVVKKLLNDGMDPNIIDNHNESPLMVATRAGFDEVVKVLLEFHANPNIIHVVAPGDDGIEFDVKYRRGMTALMYAAEDNQYGIMKLLLEYGADLNTTDAEGKTPLIFMAKANSLEMVKILLAKGADPNVKPLYGRTALMYAIEHKNDEMIKELVAKGADLKSADRISSTTLMQAVLTGDLDLVKMCIEKGVDINAQEQNGETALMLAIQNDYDEIANLLLDQGVNVNAVSQGDMSALVYAIIRGNCSLVKTLLAKGVDFNIESQGGTAIKYAIARGNLEILGVLLEEGANPNVSYDVSIRYVAERDYFAPMLRGGWGYMTPLTHAIVLDHYAMVNLLLQYKANVDKDDLKLAIYHNNPAILRALIVTGVNLEDGYTYGITPLIEAINRNNLKIVKLLIDGGAKLPEIQYFSYGALTKLSSNRWLNLPIKKEIVDELKWGQCSAIYQSLRYLFGENEDQVLQSARKCKNG